MAGMSRFHAILGNANGYRENATCSARCRRERIQESSWKERSSIWKNYIRTCCRRTADGGIRHDSSRLGKNISGMRCAELRVVRARDGWMIKNRCNGYVRRSNLPKYHQPNSNSQLDAEEKVQGFRVDEKLCPKRPPCTALKANWRIARPSPSPKKSSQPALKLIA